MSKRGPLPRLLPLTAALLLASCGRPVQPSDDGSETTNPGPGSAGDDGPSDDDLGDEAEGDDGDEGSEMGFVPNEDPHSPNECDAYLQNCPEGEKCVPVATSPNTFPDVLRCVPVSGSQAPGEPCISAGLTMGFDDCDADSFCYEVVDNEGELTGTCRAMCTGGLDELNCAPGSSCDFVFYVDFPLCLIDCDPLAQNCEAGSGCFFDGQSFRCLSAEGELPVLSLCSFTNDCAPSLICTEGEQVPGCMSESCCTPFCDLELGDSPCEAAVPGSSCTPFFSDDPPLGYEQVGVCSL